MMTHRGKVVTGIAEVATNRIALYLSILEPTRRHSKSYHLSSNKHRYKVENLFF